MNPTVTNKEIVVSKKFSVVRKFVGRDAIVGKEIGRQWEFSVRSPGLDEKLLNLAVSVRFPLVKR